ncbi:MAG: M48 family metallopeptidase [Tannerellaceae bacterium]|jgi:predicted metal-dependent hydrolase|nr:M48 family metallopeptidase [Tannerellaceae bacterium]
MEKQYHDAELGSIIIRTSAQAKRYTLRVKNGLIFAVMPSSGSEKILLNFIHEKRSQLKKLLNCAPSRKIIGPEIQLQTNTFRLSITLADRVDFYMRLKKEEEVFHISCPQQTDFTDPRVQNLLQRFIESALEHEAKRILPGRLRNLAEQYGFKYVSLRLANTKSRWGSCSTERRINISIALMLLPDHLIDYVILHELCHTVEMNHSARFWELMNNVTENRAFLLRKELKGYSTHIF